VTNKLQKPRNEAREGGAWNWLISLT
jgi:hypothetical protein